MTKKVQMTILVTKSNADNLRKLVWMSKAEGEDVSISGVIDGALTKIFEDPTIKEHLEKSFLKV